MSKDTPISMPKMLDFGGGELVEVAYLVKVLGVSRRTALKCLQVLKIRPIYLGNETYFSLPTFKRILHVLTRPGGPGFVFPGSRGPGGAKYQTIREVSQALLDEAAKPIVLAEMEVISSNDTNVLKKLLEYNKPKNPVGRPPKEKSE